MKLVWKLGLAEAWRHRVRLGLSALAMAAAACLVVWVVSGYDALLSQFDDNAEEYLGRYDLIVVPAGPDARGLAPEVIDGLRADPAVQEVNAVVQTRGSVAPAVPKSDMRLELIGGARPPVNGAPPLGPTLVGTVAKDAPYELLEGRWLKPGADAYEGVLSQGAAKQLEVSVGDDVIVTTLADQLRLKIVGIVQQAPASPDLGGGRGRGPRPQRAATSDATSSASAGSTETASGGANETPRNGAQRPRGEATGGERRAGTRGRRGDGSEAPRDGNGVRGGGPAIPVGRSGGPATSALYLPLALAQRVNGFEAPFNVVQIDLREGNSPSAFRDAWTAKFAEGRAPAAVYDYEAVLKGLSSENAVSGKAMQAYSATGIALVAALFIIFTTASMGVSERARELAVLRAVGLSQGQVARLVMFETLVLAFVGWLGGLLAGWALLAAAKAAQPELFRASELGWWSVALTGVVAFGGAVLAGVIPAWRATRISPLDAMATMRAVPSPRWPFAAAVVGLALIAVNPLIVFALDLPTETRLAAQSFVGYPLMMFGYTLLAPLIVVLGEKLLAPALALLLGVDRRLLRSQLTSNLWRTVGTTVALTVGLGLYTSTQIWGYSMLGVFFPGEWLPDAIVAFQPVGLDEAEIEEVRRVPGVNPKQFLPLALEQAKLADDPLKSAERSSVTRQDNVIVIGLDAEQAFLGDDALLRGVELVAGGDRRAIVEKLKTGRYVIVPDHFCENSGLTVGDKVAFTPPNALQERVEYEIAGVSALPGWPWITKFSGVRRHYVRTGGILFAPYDSVKRDFHLTGTDFFWFNGDGSQPMEEIQTAMQRIAERHAGATFFSPGAGQVTSHRPSARLTSTQSVREGLQWRAVAMIWGMSQIPLITLAVASLAVVNTMLASVRTRRWEMGVLRAMGVTRGGLMKLVLAEAVMIGLLASALSLGFGLMAGWTGLEMTKYSGFFGGMTTGLVVPWRQVLLGVAATVGLCVLASLFPAITAGRAEPRALLQGGRASA
ncbi:MAG TPA: FtsX-like permease family protein [Pirellulales bacterium]